MAEAADITKWKTKYHGVLEELESREADWVATEELLRKAVVRLSIAAQGVDERLDQVLQQVRKAARKGSARDRLAQAVTALSETVARIDAEPARFGDEGDRFALLLDLLKRLQLSDELRLEVRRLCAELIRVQADPERVAATIADLADVVDRGGGSDAAGAERDALLALIEAVELQVGDSGVLQSLRRRLLENELEVVKGELVGHLAGVLTAPGDDSPVLEDLLIGVLQSLAIDAQAEAGINALRARLAGGVSATDWPAVMAEVAEVINGSRRRLLDEKQELEGLIAQITSELEALTGSLALEREDLARSRRSGVELQAAVDAQVDGIEQQVDQGDDLAQLRRGVYDRIASIKHSMLSFRDREEERIAAAEQRNQQLSVEINDLRVETDSLRGKLRQNREMLLVDALTQVRSRLAYDERIQEEIARWKRFRQPLAIGIWDVDRFKDINDRFGHPAGDRALRMIAGVMQSRLRETDLLARMGGEEFAMLLPGCTGETALALAEELRAAVNDCGFNHRGEPVAITISCGLTEYHEGDDARSIYERADAALYQAKREGRNRCRLS